MIGTNQKGEVGRYFDAARQRRLRPFVLQQGATVQLLLSVTDEHFHHAPWLLGSPPALRRGASHSRSVSSSESSFRDLSELSESDPLELDPLGPSGSFFNPSFLDLSHNFSSDDSGLSWLRLLHGLNQQL